MNTRKAWVIPIAPREPPSIVSILQWNKVPTGWFNDVYVSGSGPHRTWENHRLAQVVAVRTNAGQEGKMETIEEHRAHSGCINLVILKTEIVCALSAVGSAASIEERRQADAAYKKALCTARGMGYRPHIRAADGQQIKVEWVALGEATFCEGHANIARQAPTTSKRERG